MRINFPEWETNCKAWLFDLDGTLIDSALCVETAWRRWCDRHALNAEKIISEAHGRRTVDSLKIILPQWDLDPEIKYLEDLECELVDGLTVAPGAHQLLEAVSGQPWAIVTSGSTRLATHRINHTGLPQPPVLISADHVLNGKPDPEGYLAAAKALDVAPADCIVVEDAPAGVCAGKSAGMKVIAVASTHPAKELVGADYVCASLIQLLTGIRIQPCS